ncbi:MAG: hypothetical protein A2Y72_05620 [Chloroflexi bacterium RBG_13_53_26]|nr:MAG: hypothetical protein A2Y72_05620 [Chloroflexi bacterium RBG_13_53_26]
MTAICFLNGFNGDCIESPVLEANPEISFGDLEPHLGQLAGLSPSLMGRINSNSFRHLGQRYSYIAISHTLLNFANTGSCATLYYPNLIPDGMGTSSVKA